MIERFKTSLSYPKLIGKYATDKPLRIFLYIVLVSLLCLLPTFIRTVQIDGISKKDFTTIKEGIVEEGSNIPNGGIIDYKLSVDKSAKIEIGKWIVFFNEENPELQLLHEFIILLKTERVEVFYNGVLGFAYTYKEMKLENYDFATLKDFSNANYSDSVYILEKSINYCISEMSSVYKPLKITVTFLSTIVEYLLTALMLAVIFRLWNPLPFKVIFKISTYAVTMTMMLILIGDLFGFNFLYFVGLLISIFYITFALRAITVVRIKQE